MAITRFNAKNGLSVGTGSIGVIDLNGNVEVQNLGVTGSITPSSSGLYDLGSSTKVWRNMFVANISGSLTSSNVSAGQVVVAGTGGVLSGSNNFWWNNSTQSVGIGTSSPFTTFDVMSSISPIARFASTAASNYIQFTYSTSSDSGIIGNGSSVVGSAANADFGIRSLSGNLLFAAGSSSERVRIDTSGNVGIGTATVRETLQVVGNIKVGTTATDSFIVFGDEANSGRNNGIYRPASSNTMTLGAYSYMTFNVSANSLGSQTERMRIDSSGNAGIGTNTYTARLFVSGSSTATTPTLVVREGVVSPTGGAGTFDIQNSAGTSLLFVSGSGYVGIGISTPGSYEKLTVWGGNVRIQSTAASPGVGASLILADSNNYSFARSVMVGLSSELALGTDATEKVRITNGGNVGIGTTTTGDKLAVNGSMSVTGSALPGTDNLYNLGSPTKRWANVYATSISGSLTGSNVSAGQVVVAGTGGVLSGSNNFWWDNSNTRVGIGTASPIGKLSVGSGNQSVVIDSTGTGGVGTIQSYNGALKINDLGNNTILNTGGGTVGIGTTNPPASKLFVSGSGTLADTVAIFKAGVVSPTGGAGVLDVQNSAGTSLLFVSGSGLVGIGSNSPITKLDVYDSVAVQSNQANIRAVYTGTKTAGYGGSIGLGGYWSGTSPTTFSFIVGGKDNSTDGDYGGHLQFWTRPNGSNYSERLRIDSSGNVGIGTSSYTARLLVSGSSTASTPTMVVREGVVSPTGGAGTFDVQNSAGTTLLFVSGSGRIGIGTSVPGYDLQIGSGATVGTRTLGIIDSGYGIRLLGGNGNGIVQSLGVTVPLEFQAGNSNNGNYIFSSTGNVGIGTATVTSKLHVYTTQNDATATPSVDINAAFVRLGDATTSLTFNNGVGIKFHDGGNVHYSIGQLSGNFYMSQTSDNGNVLFSSGRTDVIVFNSSGNVGIGNTTPGDKLSVNGSMSVTGSALPGTDNLYNLGSATKRWANVYATSISGSLTGSNVAAGQVVVAGTGGVLSGSNNFWWDNANERIGIGTNSPSYKLDVYGSGLVTSRVVSTNSQANLTLNGTFGQLENVAGDFYITNDAASPIIFRTNIVRRMDLLSNGGLSLWHAYTDSSNNKGLILSSSVYSGAEYATIRTLGIGSFNTTNIGIVLAPTGSGAITANMPDGTTVGGNARGTNAVDFQVSRTANTQVASGNYSFVVGQNNAATGIWAASIGIGNTTGGNGSIAVGQGNTASGGSSISMGYANVSSNSAATSFGTTNTASGVSSFVAGQFSLASGNQSVAMGQYVTGSANNAVAFGSGSIASNISAVAIGEKNTASNLNDLAMGQNSTASGQNSISIGSSNTANALLASAIGGISNTASGIYSVAMGAYNTASGYASTVRGLQSKAYLTGQDTYGAGPFATNGDAQYSRLIMRNSTTNDVETELFTNGTSARAVLPASTTWVAEIEVVGRASTGTSHACFKRRCLISRDGSNNTTLVGSVQVIGSDIGSNNGSPPALWGVTVSADDTNESLKVAVTGGVSTNIRWVARIDLVEVGY